MGAIGESIWVLHVDDEPDLTDIAATFLEREDDRFEVETATSASEGLDRLADDDFDCVISDYDMPGQNGIEFLEAVREEYSDLPFILYTGKGSEEVASDAIFAGVTDYLQKESGTSQYTVLANRISNAVEQRRTSQRAVELDRIRTLVSDINQAIVRAESPTEVKSRVCEIFSESEPYRFAWIGEIDPDTNHVDPQVSAGVEQGYLDDISITINESPTGQGPGGTAIRERRVVVSQDIAENPEFEPWRTDALKRGYQSVAAVPLDHRNTLYGELVVYAKRPYAFDDTERDMLAELGGDVAHVLHSFDVRADLRAEREFIEQALDSLNDVFYVVNTDGTLRRWNDQFREVTGYTDEAIAEMQATEFFPGNERERIASAIDKVLTTGETIVESEFLTADGDRLPYEFTGSRLTDPDGDPIGLIGIGRDITERKRQEHQHEQIINRVTDAIVEVDADWKFTLINEQAEDLYGMSEDSLLGQDFWNVFEEARGTRFEEQYREVMETRESSSFVGYFSGLDGWFDIDVHPKQHGGLVFYFQEVTDQRQQRRKLERQNERLDKSVSTVSHDLRNPLNVAEGRLELVREECDSEHLDGVAKTHERMETLIDDLLTLAREGEEVADPEPVDLAGFIESCWQNVETVEATLVAETDWTIRANQSRLAQLLENLFRNAVEHGGEDVAITVGDLDDGFYVEDDGPGIPEDEREQLLESGYSTSEEGTGFGLAIVNEIVEAHDWGIRATESDAGGARFEITGVESA